MPLPFLPPARPRLTKEKVEAMAREAGVTASVYLVGVRGYYHDDHAQNDRGIYDDAMFLVSPQNFVSFNANVDPSVARQGIAKSPVIRYNQTTIHIPMKILRLLLLLIASIVASVAKVVGDGTTNTVTQIQ